MSYRLVSATGPTPNRTLAVGEAPGKEENEQGRVFVGKAGKLFNEYLGFAGLRRQDIRVTNLYNRWTGPGDPDPTNEQIASASDALVAEFEECKPDYVLLLGLVPTRYFLGPKATMDAVHGWPQHVKHPALLSNKVFFPAYHPAAALRDPLMSARCLEDLKRFAQLVGGRMMRLGTSTFAPVLKMLLKRNELPEVVHAPDGVVIDTEGVPNKPAYLSFYTGGSTAFVVRAGDVPFLKFSPETKAIYHSALYDITMIRAMGGRPPAEFYDTIVPPYLLQYEPQGLKPLAHRLLGMEMRSYDDVVRPHFNRVAQEWIARADRVEWAKPKARFVTDSNGEEKLYKPHGLNRRLKALANSGEIEKAWEKIDPELRRPAEAKLGPFPDFHIEHVPEAEAVDYACDDVIAPWRLKPVLDQRITEAGLGGVLRQDLDFLPMVQRMQEVGLPVSVRRGKSLLVKLDRIMVKARLLIHRLTDGSVMNPGSDDQVASWLYGVKKVKGGWEEDPRTARARTRRSTPGGRPSTDDRALSVIVHKDDTPPYVKRFAESVLDYREAEKYKGTYVLPIVAKVPHSHGGLPFPACYRLHFDLRTTRVATGRISSSDPNVLAMPVRTELGKLVRGMFVMQPGKLFLSVDLSQIEVRMAAHLSADTEMCRIFREGRDIYTETSERLFETEDERQTSKTLTLGILYGLGYKNYHERLQAEGIFRFSLDDCADHIQDWYRLFKGVKAYMDGQAAFARQYGYVVTLSGRRRDLPNCRLKDRDLYYARSEAERQAGNTPVQGGAQDYTKRAGKRLWDWIKAMPDGEVEPLLQIHDEYLLEVPEAKADRYGKIVKRLMEDEREWKFKVPIVANWTTARDWGKIKG